MTQFTKLCGAVLGLVAAMTPTASFAAPKIDIEISEIMPTVRRTAPPHATRRPARKREYHRATQAPKPPVVVKPKPVAPPTDATSPAPQATPPAESYGGEIPPPSIASPAPGTYEADHESNAPSPATQAH
ncbi:MAG TPA: hypothetical protein VGK19_22745 [Capsulimonadaceae bacterium]|jgi:hypothetical protein